MMSGSWPDKERRAVGDRRVGSTPLSIAEQAAELAAQSIARIHRRRLVFQCFLAALITSTAICLPIVIIAGNGRAKTSKANAAFNCDQWREGATVLKLFIASDAKLRHDLQNYNAKSRARINRVFNGLLGKGFVDQLQKRSDSLDRATQGYWKGDLEPRLQKLASSNCSRKIQ